ncbi:hypothetical protein DMENIID0001_020010 [Sergentomyia squamirostris]
MSNYVLRKLKNAWKLMEMSYSWKRVRSLVFRMLHTLIYCHSHSLNSSGSDVLRGYKRVYDPCPPLPWRKHLSGLYNSQTNQFASGHNTTMCTEDDGGMRAG